MCRLQQLGVVETIVPSSSCGSVLQVVGNNYLAAIYSFLKTSLGNVFVCVCLRVLFTYLFSILCTAAVENHLYAPSLVFHLSH